MCLDMSGYVSGILVLPHFVPPSRCGQWSTRSLSLPATLVLDQPERLEVIFCRHTGTWKSRPSVWRIVQRKNFREEVKSRYCSRSSGISASSCFASCNRCSFATSSTWKERMFNWGLGVVWVYIIACWGPLFLYSLCDMKIETGLFSLILRFLPDQQECSFNVQSHCTITLAVKHNAKVEFAMKISTAKTSLSWLHASCCSTCRDTNQSFISPELLML